MRLFEQEGMHYGPKEAPGFDDRAAYFQGRVDVVQHDLATGGDAAALFFSVIAMSYWFIAAPQMVRMIFGDVTTGEARSRYRARVVANAIAIIRETEKALP